MLMVQQSVVSEFAKLLGSQSVIKGTSIYAVPCNTNLPTFSFEIGAKNYTIGERPSA